MDFLKLMVAATVALSAATVPVGAQDRFKAGLADIITTDSVDGVKMAGLILYPTMDAGVATQIALFSVAATRRATLAQGRFPLIVFSHNAGGTRMDNHDSLEALTRAGFITAALEHPRDNYRDQTGWGTDRQLIGRSHHIKAFIDGILADPTFGPAVDKTRIGIVGFSYGGYTALTAIGGKPNFALAAERVKADPTDRGAEAVVSAQALRRRPGFEPLTDPRIRAAVIMVPTLGYLFDRASLANVKAAVRLYRAGDDVILGEPHNVENIRQNLPTPPEYVVAEGTGHFIYFAPCSQDLEIRTPWKCKDVPGIDRVAFHKKLNAEIVDFFRRTLDVP